MNANFVTTRCGWCYGEGALRDADGKLGEDCPRCHGASVNHSPGLSNFAGPAGPVHRGEGSRV